MVSLLLQTLKPKEMISLGPYKVGSSLICTNPIGSLERDLTYYVVSTSVFYNFGDNGSPKFKIGVSFFDKESGDFLELKGLFSAEKFKAV